MYSPVVRPCAHASSAATRAVVPLPFVPVTWIVGYVSCGSESSVASEQDPRRGRATMRLSRRPSSSATASRKFIVGCRRARSAARTISSCCCVELGVLLPLAATTSSAAFARNPSLASLAVGAPERRELVTLLRQPGGLRIHDRRAPGGRWTKPSASVSAIHPAGCRLRIDEGGGATREPVAGSLLGR